MPISDSDFNVDGTRIEYPQPHANPLKITWRAFESWVRRVHDKQPTDGVETDAYCPDEEVEIEIKSTIPRYRNGSQGRMIMKKHQHEAVISENRKYVFGLLEMVEERVWEVRDAVLLPADLVDEECVSCRKWVDHNGYQEMGIPWRDIPHLNWYPSLEIDD